MNEHALSNGNGWRVEADLFLGADSQNGCENGSESGFVIGTTNVLVSRSENEYVHESDLVNANEDDHVVLSKNKNSDVELSESGNENVASSDHSKVCKNQNESFLPNEKEIDAKTTVSVGV